MNTSTANTSTEDRALELLSSGIEAEHVASALGVTTGRISQIISDPVFAQRLAELKFEQLRKHNATDNEYDALEKQIIEQIKRSLPMVMDTMKLARILQVINSAKRRGASAPDSLVRQRPTVRLNIGVAVMNRFALNGSNQVVQATIGEQTQDLVTIQSGGVQRLLNEQAKLTDASANQVRLTNESNESKGVRWTKPQGREKHDLLSECGFAHEIEVSQSEQASG